MPMQTSIFASKQTVNIKIAKANKSGIDMRRGSKSRKFVAQECLDPQRKLAGVANEWGGGTHMSMVDMS